MANDSTVLSAILEELGMPTLLENFRNQKIDFEMSSRLSDAELNSLGICTIGDRLRFRLSVEHRSQNMQTLTDRPGDTGSGTGSFIRPSGSSSASGASSHRPIMGADSGSMPAERSTPLNNGSQTLAQRIQSERSRLYASRSSRGTQRQALSILQNGKIPEFLEPDAISELFDSEQPDPIIQMIRNGIDVLGLYRVGKSLPFFQHLFRNKRVTLTMKKLTSLLKPDFSEEGSNARMYEKNLYSHFVKYVRETASGRRQNVTLSAILLFTTGTEEEPTLGFGIHPEIGFPESFASFIPTANTCINKLHLPRPSEENPLPPTEILFNLYDYAFSNSYFGMV